MSSLTFVQTPNIGAWCGAAADQQNSRLIVGLAGGHADGNWNGVASIAFNQTTPAWTLHYAGSNYTGNDQPYYADGRPASRHTYHTQQYAPETNRLMMFGTGALAGATGVVSGECDGFNFATNDYDPAGTYPSLPGGGPTQVAYTTARDPATGNIYALYADGGNNVIARWNPNTNSFTTGAAPGYLKDGYYMAADVDTTRNRFVAFDPPTQVGRACIYSISGNSWSETSMSPALQRQSGAFYCAALDKFLAKTGAAGGAVLEINPSTFAVSSLSTTGGGSIPETARYTSNGIGCFSRFAYMPAIGCAVYMPSQSSNVWAIKLHEA